jgi:hypothetical protein
MLEVYQQMGIPARLSTTLQGQLVEMYSALKQGICALYLVSGAPKYPTKVEKNDDGELATHVEVFFTWSTTKLMVGTINRMLTG